MAASAGLDPQKKFLTAHLDAVLALRSCSVTSDLLDIGDWRHRAASVHIEQNGMLHGVGRLQFPRAMFPVEAKPSKIHGIGVFATRDVQPRQVLTLYPNDAMVSYWPGTYDSYVVPGTRSREEVFAIHQEYGTLLGIHRGTCLQAVGFPDLREDPAYLGHLANDAVGPETRDDEYERKLDGRVNAFFEPVHSGLYQCLVATRHRAKGEEVLVAYGAEYWQAQEDSCDWVLAGFRGDPLRSSPQ